MLITKTHPNIKETRGFAMLEAMVALVVIAFAAATVPIVTMNAKRRLEFNKRRFGAVMVRNNLISMLSRDDNWYVTVANQTGAAQAFACYANWFARAGYASGPTYQGCDAYLYGTGYFNPTTGTQAAQKAGSFAVWLDNGSGGFAGTVYYDPNSASNAVPNGFDDTGAPCYDILTPDSACPIQVFFSWTLMCGSTSAIAGGCDPNIVNVKATFNIYSGDISLSTLTALNSGGGLGGGKYEFDILRPMANYW